VAPLSLPWTGADHPVLDRDARVREVHRADRGRALVARLSRALAVIDGEHYAPVVRDALEELPYTFVAAVLAGGTEKLRGGEDYGLPLVPSLEQAIELHRPDLVVDLSDEPVLGPRERLGFASRALAAGVPYVGADFRFDPPSLAPFELPSLAVIGTGKRVGKTAVAGHLARRLAADRAVVVVAMGRGGPAEPEVIEAAPTLAGLLELSRAGRHAASDHLETALVAGVPTIGCRRCGGGLAGATFTSTVLEGARLAAGLAPDIVIFDGSGAAIPPVAVGARVLVAHDLESGLNPYRALISDLVLTMSQEVATAAEQLGRRALRFDLRLRPLERLDGRRAAVFTAGPARLDHLDGVVHASQSLADRGRLAGELERIEADVFVVELKAAAIDVVADYAAANGVDVVFATNDVVGTGLDDALLELAELASGAEARENVRQ
jgi:cyclic 2,3-diphosphoglycerate synthetase